MRIGLDARLAAYREAGIARYTRALLQALTTHQVRHQYTVFVARGRPALLPPCERVTYQPLLTPPHHRFEQLTLSLELAPHRFDVFHSPDFISPRLWRGTAAVITVHDLAFLHDPTLLDAPSRRYYGQLPAAARRAAAIMADSASTRRDLIDLAGAPPEKIRVVHLAADARFRPLTRHERLTSAATAGSSLPPDLARLLVGELGPLLLFVGTIEPRKNLPFLFEAYRRYRERAGGRAATLVLVGASGWRNERELAALERLRASGQAIWFQHVSDEQLVLLYNAATAIVLPSRYEGFGLPALEAMACGTPVLVSNAASLPEIVGDGGLVLPLDDPAAWATALLELTEDRHKRQALSAAGQRQAARFSWERAARETLEVYERAARGEAVQPATEVVESCRH